MRFKCNVRSFVVFALLLCLGILNSNNIIARPKHDRLTRKAIKQLYSIEKDGRPLFGHQDDLLYGHSFQSPKGSEKFDSSDVYSVCGDYPALLGLDLGRTEVSDINLDYQYVDNIVKAATIHYERGGYLTISWHGDNPVTNNNAWDMTEKQTVSYILNNAEYRDVFINRLSKIADILDRIRDSKGRKIPIIFRPFHEENSGFWWSTKIISSDEYKMLWRISYDYLVKKRKLKNLIWAYSPYNIRSSELYELSYPGDDYVDIVCYERYQVDISQMVFINQMKEGLVALSDFTRKHKKIAAVSECGLKSVSEENWWTEALLPSVEKAQVAYVLVWRNASNSKEYYAPYKGHKSENDFKQMKNSQAFLFLNDLKKRR